MKDRHKQARRLLPLWIAKARTFGFPVRIGTTTTMDMERDFVSGQCDWCAILRKEAGSTTFKTRIFPYRRVDLCPDHARMVGLLW